MAEDGGQFSKIVRLIDRVGFIDSLQHTKKFIRQRLLVQASGSAEARQMPGESCQEILSFHVDQIISRVQENRRLKLTDKSVVPGRNLRWLEAWPSGDLGTRLRQPCRLLLQCRQPLCLPRRMCTHCQSRSRGTETQAADAVNLSNQIGFEYLRYVIVEQGSSQSLQ